MQGLLRIALSLRIQLALVYTVNTVYTVAQLPGLPEPVEQVDLQASVRGVTGSGTGVDWLRSGQVWYHLTRVKPLYLTI